MKKGRKEGKIMKKGEEARICRMKERGGKKGKNEWERKGKRVRINEGREGCGGRGEGEGEISEEEWKTE